MSRKNMPGFVENGVFVGSFSTILQGVTNTIPLSVRLPKNQSSFVPKLVDLFTAVEEVFYSFLMFSTHISYGVG
jgi:hypothetical protein